MGSVTLRVAHIDTEKTWRGGQQQVFSLLNGLNKLGHKNFPIVRKHSALEKKLEESSQFFYSVTPWGEFDFLTARAIRRKLRENKIQIVHAHSAHGQALAALAVHSTAIPLVVTRRVDFHLRKNPFSKWKYRQAKKIIAISRGVEKILLEDGIPPEKIAVVRSGIDYSRHQNLKQLTRAEMAIPEDSFVIGQVAALAPHKDQANFLEMIKILKGSMPELIGVLVGEGALREELEDMAKKMGIFSSIRFLGFQKVVLECIKNFDIFCISSKEEGLGTSILDAMALRVPVVATKTGGIPDIVKEGETGFLAEPQNPQALAAAVNRAILMGNKREKILDQAHKMAKEYDVSSTIRETEAVYKSLLNH